MRVLVLSNLYPPNALGGYEMSCRDVVDRWRAAGHEVTVLTTSTTVGGVVEAGVDEPHVRRELDWYWSEHRFRTPPWRERAALERRSRTALRRALTDTAPDVVSAWHLGGMPLSLLSEVQRQGVPVVLNLCDEWPVYGPRADAWLAGWARCPAPVRALGAVLTGLPTHVPDLDRTRQSVVSAWLLERCRTATRWQLAAATVVGSGVDPADFPVVDDERPPWRGRLLGVGRIEPRKGFATAVQALALLPGARLRLAGVADPEHLAALLALADSLGVRDRLEIGAVPRSQVRTLYAAADTVLFPSSWEEPFGLVPLEAMTQGVPVVATRRGGSAEFLADLDNCLVVPHEDPAALAAAVDRLAADPALRARLAVGGRATADRYGVDRLAAVLERLHLSVLPVPVLSSQVLDRRESACEKADVVITVVVSTYGRSGYLHGLLQRLDAQDHPRFEVVVCDNGSPDDTWDVLTDWVARTALPATVLRLPFHDGPAVPRNTALAVARAPLVAFTDDDCLPAPGWLSALTAALVDPAVAVAQGLTRPEQDGWGGPWGRTLSVAGVSGLTETANLGCRRADVLAVGGFPSARLLSGRAFGEDVLLGARLARRGKVRTAPQAVVEHRVLPGSYRDHLHERHRLRGFPLLARAVPELRRGAVLGVFLSRRSALVDVGVAGVVLAAALRTVGPLALATPWAVSAWQRAAGRPGRPRPVRAAQIGVGDLVGLAGLLEGSVRARRLLL